MHSGYEIQPWPISEPEEPEELDQYEIDERNDAAGLVRCDDNCGAKQEPETLEEALTAAEHWKSHGHLHGCSHGN